MRSCDRMDPDEEPREYGVEFGDYYSTLQPAYEPRNGPLQPSKSCC